MLLNQTLDQLRHLRLSGMAAAFSEQLEQPELQALSFEERFTLPCGGNKHGLTELLSATEAYDAMRSTFATWIERWLNEVGIPVHASPQAFNVIVARVRERKNLDMWILGAGLPPYPTYLNTFFHSRYASRIQHPQGLYPACRASLEFEIWDLRFEGLLRRDFKKFLISEFKFLSRRPYRGNPGSQQSNNEYGGQN
jgi:hypothetical protein